MLRSLHGNPGASVAFDFSASDGPDWTDSEGTTTSTTDWDVVVAPPWANRVRIQLDPGATGPLWLAHGATGLRAAARDGFPLAAGVSMEINLAGARATSPEDRLLSLFTGVSGDTVYFLWSR